MRGSTLPLAAGALLLGAALASPLQAEDRTGDTGSCRKTKVAVLNFTISIAGAGCAGIFAAQALHNHSVDDFVIVEYNGEIGGRVKHTTFGKKPGSNEGYTVELGANWVQGIVSKGGPENPIWRLAKKYKLQNTYSNYSSIQTFTEAGAVDYSNLFNKFDNAYSNFEQDAGYVLTQNLQDRSARTGFSLAGWTPRMNAQQQAIEWFEFDFEYGETPERSSHQWSVINFNTTFYQYSDANNYVFDPRGFSTFISGEASTFLKKNDPRLLLNTVVTSIDHSASGVTIHTKNAGCISADYAIMTFSVGVLQSDAVAFSPQLPVWKRTAIESMDMSTYTKIFLQFPADQVFWNKSTQFFLYADPVERGNYPLFQSLDSPGFLPGSGILFVTVVQDQSFAAERQSSATTQAEVMAVLRKMFPHKTVPDPIAFMYPKWSTEPWAYGSYSNWPVGLTLEMHENLRAPVDRLWFAGEATSAEYYGFLQGAYFEGQAAGTAIAECINGNKSACAADAQYDTLHGPSPYSQYAVQNGWTVSPFLTYGF